MAQTNLSSTELAGRIIEGNLDRIGQLLIKELRKELEAQGHKDTGALIQSIEHNVEVVADKLALLVRYNSYGQILNDGVSPNKVPFGGAPTGAKTSKFIEALAAWVTRKGLATTSSQALGVAIAIAKKQKKEGIPTNKSRAMRLRGGLGFQDYVLSEFSEDIIRILSEGLGEAFTAEVSTFLFPDISIK